MESSKIVEDLLEQAIDDLNNESKYFFKLGFFKLFYQDQSKIRLYCQHPIIESIDNQNLMKEVFSKFEISCPEFLDIDSKKYISILLKPEIITLQGMKKSIQGYHDILRKIFNYQEEVKLGLFESEKNKVENLLCLLVEMLESVGFKSIKRNSEVNMAGKKYQLLVGLNLNKNFETFPVLVIINSWSITLRCIFCKDTKPFSYGLDQILEEKIEVFLLKINPVLNNVRLLTDHNKKCAVLETSFITKDLHDKEIQRLFIMYFYKVVENFNKISPFIIKIFQGKDVDESNAILNIKNHNNSDPKDWIFSLNHESINKALYPRAFKLIEYPNIDLFLKELKILDLLRPLDLNFWHIIDKSSLKIYYPKFYGSKVSKIINLSKKTESKLIDFKLRLLEILSAYGNASHVFDQIYINEMNGANLLYLPAKSISILMQKDTNCGKRINMLNDNIENHLNDALSIVLAKVEISLDELDSFDLDQKEAVFIGDRYRIFDLFEIYEQVGRCGFESLNIVAWLKYSDRYLLLVVIN